MRLKLKEPRPCVLAAKDPDDLPSNTMKAVQLVALCAVFLIGSLDALFTCPNDTKLNLISTNRLVPDVSVNITNASALPLLQSYKGNLKTVIFILDENQELSSSIVQNVIKAYKFRKNRNLILVNFTKAEWQLKRQQCANEVAREVANAIVTLSKKGMDVRQLQVVGYRHGALIAGVAGQKLHGKVGSIVALNPVFPLRLNSTARFVQSIRTVNSTLLGRLGHANFFLNGGNGQQPGCTGAADTFECSDKRVLEVFAESVVLERNFVASECRDWKTFVLGACDGNQKAVMGAAANPKTRGNFYLRTGRQPPFGLGQRGAKASRS